MPRSETIPRAKGAHPLAAALLLRASPLLFTASLLAGCLFGGEGGSSRGVKVKPEILRVGNMGAAKVAASRAPVPPAADPAWSSALSITTFKVPVKRISLHNGSFTKSADLYSCAGEAGECDVEAAGAAFENELNAAAVTVERGEYRYLFVKSCEDSEGEYRGSLTATVDLGGRAWHTHPTAVLDSAGPARPLFIRVKGCGRTYALPQPLRISDSLGSQVSFRMYFDLEELAYAALGSRATARAWTPGNCAGDRPAETDAAGPPFLCIGYPELSGIVDTAPVALERYRVNGGATLGLFFTGASDLPVGGYLRRYYREGATLDPGFPAARPLRELSRNADGTLSLAAFGGGPTGLEGSAFRVEAFRRASHSGSYTSLPDSAGVPTSGSYSASRL